MYVSPSDAFAQLAEMIADAHELAGPVALTDRLAEDLGLDWLAKGSLVTQVGDRWGVKVTCAESTELRTVGDLVDLITRDNDPEAPTT